MSVTMQRPLFEADALQRSRRDYCAFMSCSAGDRWMTDAIWQISAWLRERSLDVDLGANIDVSSGTSRISVRRIQDQDTDDLTVRLVERNDGGEWTTTIVAHDEPGPRDWISLDVTNSEGQFVSVPRLAKYLMDVLPLHDGLIKFRDSADLYHAADIDRLLTLLADDQRHGIVLVAGTQNDDLYEPFRKRVNDWAKQVYGLAEVVVLDPDATVAFEQRIGRPFWAPEWTIRTYHPGVRFDDAKDSRRHRMVGSVRLGEMRDAAIARLLGDIARTQAATRPLDPAFQRVQRRFDRFENRLLVESLAIGVEDHVAPPPSTLEPSIEPAPTEPTTEVRTPIQVDTPVEVPTYLDVEPPVEVAASRAIPLSAKLTLVMDILGIDDVTESTLHEIARRAHRPDVDPAALKAFEVRIEKLQATAERTEDQNRELLVALEAAHLEAEIAHLDVEKRDEKIGWLQSRLKEEGDYEASYLELPDQFRSTRPADFEELLTWADDLASVVFYGDRSEVVQLSQIDLNDAALRTAWDAIVAMQDYARARAEGACAHGLDHYLQHTPSGFRTFPPGKFAETETGITMAGFGAERVFPVPTEVHPSGRITMKAHFKLAHIGMASPRMYIHDGHPTLSKLYIGYLGTHPTNTQTR